MVESREHVNRSRLLEKLAWELGIDWHEIQDIKSLEFYKQGVSVSIGFTERQFIPWQEKRKGIGSVLGEFHESSHEQDQLQLIPSDE